jgi:Uma2 family endonuclease
VWWPTSADLTLPSPDAELCVTTIAEQIMGMPERAPKRWWTEEEFYAARDAAPPGERWELVDGEVLVTPGPHWMHQRVIAQMFALIHPYVRAQGFGEAFLSPVDVKLEPGLVMQPDLLVVPKGELRKRSDFIQHLVLAAEVLSPSSARYDRVTKRPAYQRNRVSEYWIVDEQSRTIERWRPGDDRPEVVSEEFVWHPAGAREPFTLALPEFFRGVLPEDENAE